MNLKSWLLENFLTFVEKKIDCGKLPHLWKVSFIKEKSLFVENFLDQGRIFVCGKLPCL